MSTDFEGQCPYNKDTKLILSLSSNPSNNGTFLYNYLFRKLGINAAYFSRKVDFFDDTISSMKKLCIKGASLSMPLKEFAYNDSSVMKSDSANFAKSINTLVEKNGNYEGHCTDIDGVLYALKNVEKEINNVLLFGSGGVVGATVVALRKMNPQVDIQIVARNRDKAESKLKNFDINWCDKKSYDLIVNCTPVKDVSDSLEDINAEILLDFPIIRDFSNSANFNFIAEQGGDYISGFEIFKGQFMRQFEIYTGKKVDAKFVVEAFDAFNR